ncbi:hypothetical protein A3H16_01615 [Candidatus Kaiserbacteria bacterium RIFCSPLOWO2_12_FULL_53_8]|uniref:Uncharacterized protein n=1 Tax=Candidatus Kaiserbacteria bacterium RIFCSPLOWO2_12_FULL_53_8 TaxID=1798529 RepID=A0A1F6FZN3_9BACT|nr:MAG: hypothetical protein A3H16_01615 [Candidatus Kaiserbacteria bacterium RIFCSPLOWO2_12_FULL_53_8]
MQNIGSHMEHAVHSSFPIWALLFRLGIHDPVGAVQDEFVLIASGLQADRTGETPIGLSLLHGVLARAPVVERSGDRRFFGVRGVADKRDSFLGGEDHGNGRGNILLTLLSTVMSSP